MKTRRVLWGLAAAAALCLAFFENGTGTRIILCQALLLPLIPLVRRALFDPDAPAAEAPRQAEKALAVLRPADAPTDVRPYQPGDPVNRIHWKLTAKRDEVLVRQAETEQEEAPEPRQAPDRALSAARKRPGRLLAFAALIPAGLALLIPEARAGLAALCNRLFAASEAVNAYVYARFPVPDGQPAALAVILLGAAAALAAAALLVSGSRPLCLGLMAALAAAQIYFGLSLPVWAHLLLFALFTLCMLRRPWPRKAFAPLLAALLASALVIALVFPGQHRAVESASETVRDWLSRIVSPLSESLRETPLAAQEARPVHTRTLTEGAGEAGTEREFRLRTLAEKQIAMPEWIDWLKTGLMILLSLALLLLPFAPFALLNARQKKARERELVYRSEDVSAAVAAIFQQVTVLLEAVGLGAGNLPYRLWADRLPADLPGGYRERFRRGAELFEEAAYSEHALGEDERGEALALLEETEEEARARAGWRQRLRLHAREGV